MNTTRLLVLLPLVMIGVGVWMLSPAWSLIVVGGLVWIDLNRGVKKS